MVIGRMHSWERQSRRYRQIKNKGYRRKTRGDDIPSPWQRGGISPTLPGDEALCVVHPQQMPDDLTPT